MKDSLSVLIIGGTGCISSAVVAECLKNGISTTIINRGSRPNLIPKDAIFIKADRSDKKTIKKKIQNKHFDAVVDFLCYTKEELQQSLNLYKSYASQYFFISSCAVYDFRKTHLGEEESPKVDDRWEYSVNKWAAEETLRSICKGSECSYTIIRPSITYGDTRIPYGVTPPYGKHGTIIKRILNNKPLIRWNQGQNKCNMMRVEDFARAFVKLIGNENAYNEAFNICSEKAYSYNEVLNLLRKKLNKEIRIVDLDAQEYSSEVPERKGEIIAGRGTDCISSMAKLKKLFPEFKEEYTLETGIGKTVDAYLSQNCMDGISWEFEGECDRIVALHDKRVDGRKTYELGFIDYLNNAQLKDKINYYIFRHKGRFDSTLLHIMLRIFNKINRMMR